MPILAGLLAGFAGAILGPTPASSQAIDSTLWVTDGRVSAIASAGPTLYIGGQFTSVGPA